MSDLMRVVHEEATKNWKKIFKYLSIIRALERALNASLKFNLIIKLYQGWKLRLYWSYSQYYLFYNELVHGLMSGKKFEGFRCFVQNRGSQKCRSRCRRSRRLSSPLFVLPAARSIRCADRRSTTVDPPFFESKKEIK